MASFGPGCLKPYILGAFMPFLIAIAAVLALCAPVAAQGPGDGAEMLTPYDPHSVMNYCNPKYNNDGRLSVWDIAALQRMYGAR